MTTTESVFDGLADALTVLHGEAHGFELAQAELLADVAANGVDALAAYWFGGRRDLVLSVARPVGDKRNLGAFARELSGADVHSSASLDTATFVAERVGAFLFAVDQGWALRATALDRVIIIAVPSDFAARARERVLH